MRGIRSFGLTAAAVVLALGMSGAGAAASWPAFEDDFSQPDGPALAWTPVQMEYDQVYQVEAGEYSLSTPYAPPRWDVREAWAYAGMPPAAFAGDLELAVDVHFIGAGSWAVGRHAGIEFFAAQPLQRQHTNGYTVHWIDRQSDRGYAFWRWDADGTEAALLGLFLAQDPGMRWDVRVAGEQITLTVDGAFIGSVTDNTYREGYVALWTYADGQHVHFDNVSIQQIVREVAIDIKPGSDPNSINPKSKGNIPVAILGASGFDPRVEVASDTLTFGRAGDEPSLRRCAPKSEDVNGDGLPDLVCHFDTQQAGFQARDELGVLMGETVDGRPIQGTDAVRIVPSK